MKIAWALCPASLFTSAEREVKDSRRSGTSHSCFFWDKIGSAKSVGFRFFSAIWRSDCQISSSYLEISSISLIYSLPYSREKELLCWLSWGLSRPHMCDPSDQRRLQVEGFADCAAATQGSLGYEKQLWNYALVLGQNWAFKFVTFRLVSAISRNETGVTSRYLEE